MERADQERTTLDRIADLHRGLATMAAQASAAERTRLERLRALERRIERPERGGWLVAVAFTAAVALWFSVLSLDPWEPSAAEPSAALALPAPTDKEEAVLTRPEPEPRPEVAATHEAPPVEWAEPVAAPTRVPARHAVEARSKATPRPRPAAADPLADLDDCGDDPICGL